MCSKPKKMLKFLLKKSNIIDFLFQILVEEYCIIEKAR